MTNQFHIDNVEDLQDRFSYMFAGPNIGFDFYKGWFPTFIRLCFELDKLLGEHKLLFYWGQIKEKFGGVRLYYTLEGGPTSYAIVDGQIQPFPEKNGEIRPDPVASIRQEVLTLVRSATAQMNQMCCVCGEPATAQDFNGYWQTLCVYHQPDERAKRGDDRTLTELAGVPKRKSGTDGTKESA